MELHRMLREKRKRANLTQQQIADKLSISRSTYARYESGRSTPNSRRYNEIAMILKIQTPPTGLCTDEGIYLLDLDITIPMFQHMFSLSSIPETQLAKYKEAGSRIGKANWTIPGFMPIPFLLRIIDDDYDASKIDDYFTQSFLCDDEKEVKELLSKLSNELSDKYKTALEEIEFSYINNRFISCAVLLFPVLEGVVRDFNTKDKDSVNVEGLRIKDNGSYNSPTIYAHLKSVNKFLENYFSSGIVPSSTITKRNSLLHGESFSVDRKTCIRLLNCIDSVMHIDIVVTGCAKQIEGCRK